MLILQAGTAVRVICHHTHVGSRRRVCVCCGKSRQLMRSFVETLLWGRGNINRRVMAVMCAGQSVVWVRRRWLNKPSVFFIECVCSVLNVLRSAIPSGFSPLRTEPNTWNSTISNSRFFHYYDLLNCGSVAFLDGSLRIRKFPMGCDSHANQAEENDWMKSMKTLCCFQKAVHL